MRMRNLLVLMLLLLELSSARAATDEGTAAVMAVDSVAVTVSDMNRAIDFYTHVLTFEKVADREVAGDEYEHLFGVFGLRVRSVRMRLGDEHLELMQFLAPHGRPIPADSHSNDRWFQHIAIIVTDMSAAYARLRSFNVEHASSGPQRLPDWNPNAGGIEAFYFHDPDGHNLEVLSFPPDKGPPKWHVKNGPLFLGIDHTAIVGRHERQLRLGAGASQQRIRRAFAHHHVAGNAGAGRGVPGVPRSPNRPAHASGHPSG
jgi:catechol 2,3-dioxygenase-like lactoylglutathione lyase family enzyme